MSTFEKVSRRRFRRYSWITLTAGIGGYLMWFVIALLAPESRILGALGGIAIFIGIFGTPIGAVMLIRSKFAKSTPTPWQAPAFVATVILGISLVVGFIPNYQIQVVTSWIVLLLIPLILYLIVWAIVMAIKGRKTK